MYDVNRFKELNQPKKKYYRTNYLFPPTLKKRLFSWLSTLAEKWVEM